MFPLVLSVNSSSPQHTYKKKISVKRSNQPRTIHNTHTIRVQVKTESRRFMFCLAFDSTYFSLIVFTKMCQYFISHAFLLLLLPIYCVFAESFSFPPDHFPIDLHSFGGVRFEHFFFFRQLANKAELVCRMRGVCGQCLPSNSSRKKVRRFISSIFGALRHTLIFVLMLTNFLFKTILMIFRL